MGCRDEGGRMVLIFAYNQWEQGFLLWFVKTLNPHLETRGDLNVISSFVNKGYRSHFVVLRSTFIKLGTMERLRWDLYKQSSKAWEVGTPHTFHNFCPKPPFHLIFLKWNNFIRFSSGLNICCFLSFNPRGAWGGRGGAGGGGGGGVQKGGQRRSVGSFSPRFGSEPGSSSDATQGKTLGNRWKLRFRRRKKWVYSRSCIAQIKSPVYSARLLYIFLFINFLFWFCALLSLWFSIENHESVYKFSNKEIVRICSSLKREKNWQKKKNREK